MAATTTLSTSSLANQLAQDYPEFQFVKSDTFTWRPQPKIIEYDPAGSSLHLLHELSHAVLDHKDFRRDIELLSIERDAWQTARKLAAKYSVDVDETIIESDLDSYRDWLHARSRCTNCSQVGIETKKHSYNCLECGASWRVNDARRCELRRYKTK